MPPLSVIALDFHPLVGIGDVQIQIQTLALAVVFAASLLLAALIARSTPQGEAPAAQFRESRPVSEDLLFLIMGAVSGAVIGGRIGYGLLHLDYYLTNPGELVNPAQGSLELTLGVVGAVLSASYVLSLIGAPVGRWAYGAIFPLLLTLGAGKLCLVLGGSGQGAPSDLPWAVSFVGEGPWGSLAPEIASHPSQVYEGVATLLVLQLMTLLVARRAFRAPNGSALVMGLALWGGVRFLVATTWRDAPVLGPLLAEQLIALGLVASCVVLLLVRSGRTRLKAFRPDRERLAT